MSLISKEFSSWYRFPVPPSHPSHVRCFSRRSWEDLWILRGMSPLPMSSTILSRSGTYLDLGRRRFSIAVRLLFPMDYLLEEGLGRGGRVSGGIWKFNWSNHEREGNQSLDATLIFWMFEQEKITDYSVLGRVRRNRNDWNRNVGRFLRYLCIPGT